jgi:hypothetical protein
MGSAGHLDGVGKRGWPRQLVQHFPGAKAGAGIGWNVQQAQFLAGHGAFAALGGPHVIGQPHRIRAFREFLQYAKGFPDVWWTTREEIAQWYLQNHSSHIA